MQKIKWMALVTALLVMIALMSGCGGSSSDSQQSEAPAAGEQQAAETEPADDGKVYTLKFVASWNPGNVNYPRIEIWKSEIEKASNGRIQIELLGGIDIFPASETAEAVNQGVVDGAYTSSGYMASYVPEGDVLSCSNMTTAEMVASGGYDYLNGIMAAQNLYLVSNNNELEASPFHIYMVKPIATLDDLKGKKIRTSPGFWNDIIAELGGTPVPLALNEVFTALEQNMIEGYTAPSFIGSGEGFFEYAKCKVEPGFLRPGGCLIINTNSLAALPEDLQDLIKGFAVPMATAWDDQYDNTVSQPNLQALLDAGGEVVTLPPEDAEKLVQTAMDAAWGTIADKCPDKIDDLKKYFIK
ncbi:MAG: TRAP transporter substrate-binding protein DctP [Clostridiales Family XIII bacterium]|jgi:TRAP-type C4-dicarboxylate transport system substrate-binding protein|nr:TRAP transporter substrate-binding protein DctP [Clostridiales Family XIII bacterium]